MTHMTAVPDLTCAHLHLTALLPQDAPWVEALLGNADVRRYLGGPVPPAERNRRFQAYLKGAPQVQIWALRPLPPVAGHGIGLIVLAPHHNGADIEVSFQLDPVCWGHGYGSEAVARVIRHGLETRRLPRVLAETQTSNARSCRLLERLEMVEIDRLRRFGAEQVIYATAVSAS